MGECQLPPHAESVMARASARGATCRLMRLFTFIVVLFLLWKLNRYSSLGIGEHVVFRMSRHF